MERKEAYEFLKRHLQNKNLIKHSLALEACMRALAKRLNENEGTWGILGLLHDIDYELVKDKEDQHTHLGSAILKEKGFDEDFLYSIRCHAEKEKPKSLRDWAIYSADPLTGLIVAATLMHPSKKISELTTEFILNRFKEKRFAAGANREIIKQCENLGLSLNEFIQICLNAMQGISEELEL
ncbi:MAG: HD domain-containing protein [Acidobacteriota bacterium]